MKQKNSSEIKDKNTQDSENTSKNESKIDNKAIKKHWYLKCSKKRFKY